jgi:hypothetical protein
MSPDQHQGCRRREPRQQVDLNAVAFQRDGSRSLVAVSDISMAGCQLTGNPDFSPSEPIRLVVPYRGDIAARVLWASDERAGATFESDAGAFLDRRAKRFTCSFNYGSGRTFGKKGVSTD